MAKKSVVYEVSVIIRRNKTFRVRVPDSCDQYDAEALLCDAIRDSEMEADMEIDCDSFMDVEATGSDISEDQSSKADVTFEYTPWL